MKTIYFSLLISICFVTVNACPATKHADILSINHPCFYDYGTMNKIKTTVTDYKLIECVHITDSNKYTCSVIYLILYILSLGLVYCIFISYLNNCVYDTENCVFSQVEDYDKFILDNNIIISTISRTCNLNTSVNISAFAEHVGLDKNDILSVKYTNSTTNIGRTATPQNPVKARLNTFHNCVNVIMKSSDSKNYNIKIFKNGSLQIICNQDMNNVFKFCDHLIAILKKGADIIDINGNTTHIDFVDTSKEIFVSDIKTHLMMANFKLGYGLDCSVLHELLNKYHRKNTTDPIIGYVDYKYALQHPNNIKITYECGDFRTSTVVFSSGTVIISGAKELRHVVLTYNYIKEIMERYYHKICLVNIDPIALQNELDAYFNEHN